MLKKEKFLWFCARSKLTMARNSNISKLRYTALIINISAGKDHKKPLHGFALSAHLRFNKHKL